MQSGSQCFQSENVYHVCRWFFFVNVDVGKEKIADGEREHRNRDSEAVEKGASDLLVIESGNDEVRLQAGVETCEVGHLSSILVSKHLNENCLERKTGCLCTVTIDYWRITTALHIWK